MLRFLFDTDHLTLFDFGHPALGNKVAQQPANSIGLSVVTAEEVLRGRLGALSQARTPAQRIARYAFLSKTLHLLGQFPVVAFDQAADTQFLQLKTQLPRIGSQDLKIAAIALVLQLTLLTRNRRDFQAIPGLTLDDWSV